MITLIALLDVGYFPEVKLLAAKGVEVGKIRVLPSKTGRVEVSKEGLRVVKRGRTLFLLVDSPTDSVVLKVPRGIDLEMATLRSEVEVRGVSLKAMAVNDVAGRLRIRGGEFGDLNLTLVDSEVLMEGCKVERMELGAMGSRITVRKSRINSLNLNATKGKMILEATTVGEFHKTVKDFRVVWR